jgi:hypothetical protein
MRSAFLRADRSIANNLGISSRSGVGDFGTILLVSSMKRAVLATSGSGVAVLNWSPSEVGTQSGGEDPVEHPVGQGREQGSSAASRPMV